MTKSRFLLLRLRCIYNVFCNLVSFRACIKVVIPSELIGIYEFSRSLSGPSFQFCQTIIRRLRSNFADANHSRDVEPKKRIVASIGRNTPSLRQILECENATFAKQKKRYRFFSFDNLMGLIIYMVGPTFKLLFLTCASLGLLEKQKE